jgi:hypothetical protein
LKAYLDVGLQAVGRDEEGNANEEDILERGLPEEEGCDEEVCEEVGIAELS